MTESNAEDLFACYEIDIVGLIKEKAYGHGISSDDVDTLLQELDASAEKVGIDPSSLYMILLDSIGGLSVGPKENILHQIKVMLDNQGVLKCFPV